MQQENGADISVDDDGMVGTVSRSAAVDGGASGEAKRQIQLILNPPTAGVGETYKGKVVNITKFGASSTSSRARRPTPHLQDGWPAGASTRSRMSSRWATRSKCASTTSIRRAGLAVPIAPLGGGEGSDAGEAPWAWATATGARPARADTVSFEDALTPN